MQQDPQQSHKRRQDCAAWDSEPQGHYKERMPCSDPAQGLPRGQDRAKNAVLSAVLSKNSTTAVQLYRAVGYLNIAVFDSLSESL
jgi:hypothetical protein